MASRFLENLLSTPYPTIFGNAMTMQEAQAAAPNGTGSLDELRRQYEADQAALLGAASNVGSLQARQSVSIPTDNPTNGYNPWLKIISANLGSSGRSGNLLEQAKSTQAAAQRNAERSLNQYLLAQQAAASRPAAQQQAVNWGQLAQAAENRMIGQAMDAARNAIANENARMATLSAHPLLGSGIR